MSYGFQNKNLERKIFEDETTIKIITLGIMGGLTAGMFAAPFVGLFTGAVIGGLISVTCIYKANGAAAVNDGCSEVDIDKE